jgi:hypothetical protein
MEEEGSAIPNADKLQQLRQLLKQKIKATINLYSFSVFPFNKILAKVIQNQQNLMLSDQNCYNHRVKNTQ